MTTSAAAMLVGERLTHPLACRVDRHAADVARRRREVHVLEHAEAAPAGREVGDRHGAAAVDTEHLARRDLAHKDGANCLERARLARDQPGLALAPEAERP